MAFLSHRVAAVRADSQGSGCLLTPRLVLTVAHVHDLSSAESDPRPAEVAVLSGNGWTPCTTVWRSAELDAALLLADCDLTPAPLEPLRWGAVHSIEPLAGVHLTGFPSVERDTAGRLDTTQALATLTPGGGLRTGRPTLVLQQQAPRASAVSPWSGMSGAPVVYRDRLLGLAIRDHRPNSWGHSQLDLLPAAALLADPGFRTVLGEHLDRLPPLEGISAEKIADIDFEREYAMALEADYGRIRIFGLRQASNLGRRGWELSTSYLSLEVRPADQPATDLPSPGPQRADRILRGRRRVLIRGQAGSGKTTLVQWLAVGAVNGTLGDELAEFNYRVPLVLQLRKLHRKAVMQPRPEQFLALDDRMCADRQPKDWAHRLLRDGRALLLVDGLDEVPEQEREEVQAWLEQLLTYYPATLALATVRPSAVPQGWLDHLGFDELLLCPMNGEDRHRFIERWHQAALHELLAAPHTDAQEHRWRKEIEQDKADLLRTLDSVPEVNQLTDSPLLCAMICALNRETDGALPRHRMALYRDAMSMMLVKRDEGRKVSGPEQLQASEEEQLAMLRRVAHWLVRNNQVEGRRNDAIAQLGKALRDLPALARRAGADSKQAYVHLLNRTGLIAETGPDTFQFVHRTFQDYLAAMEFREERDFGLLAGHAADEQWGDVIRMTVGHCGRRERAELLTAILAAGDAAPPNQQPAVSLLAATCLPHAPELDAKVRNDVLDRLRPHLPRLLTDRTDPLRLAAVGEELVPLLGELADRDPAVLEAAVSLVPNVLGLIGGDESLALLGRLARRGRPTFRYHVIEQWRQFDVQAFGRQVITRADLASVYVMVESPAQIKELIGRPTLSHLWLSGGSVPIDSPYWSQLADQVRALFLSNIPRLSDIGFLRQWRRLTDLTLLQCPDLNDLASLSALALKSLNVQRIKAEQRVDLLFAAIQDVAGLERLTLTAPHLDSLSGRKPFDTVRSLRLANVPTSYPLATLLPLFPALRSLRLDTFDNRCTALDLTPLANGCRWKIEVSAWATLPRLIGREFFPAERLTTNVRAAR